jgi:hypothetical protein
MVNADRVLREKRFQLLKQQGIDVEHIVLSQRMFNETVDWHVNSNKI